MKSVREAIQNAVRIGMWLSPSWSVNIQANRGTAHTVGRQIREQIRRQLFQTLCNTSSKWKSKK